MKTQQLPEKLYYSIGELAAFLDVKTSLIRYWEKEFDIIKPKKNKKGNRMFTPLDVENFHLIFHLVKERGYTLQGAKDHLKGNIDEAASQHEIIKRLQKIKSFLIEIKEDL